MRSPNPNLSAKLIRLDQMDREQLLSEWLKLFGGPPPKASSRKFLLRAIGYELQCKSGPSLSRADQRALKAVLGSGGNGSETGSLNSLPSPNSPRSTISLDPGARLVREWQGKTHMVSVIEEGFVYKDKVWKSLSAIAKDITGAHWSGPRFFGLNKAGS